MRTRWGTVLGSLAVVTMLVGCETSDNTSASDASERTSTGESQSESDQPDAPTGWLVEELREVQGIDWMEPCQSTSVELNGAMDRSWSTEGAVGIKPENLPAIMALYGSRPSPDETLSVEFQARLFEDGDVDYYVAVNDGALSYTRKYEESPFGPEMERGTGGSISNATLENLSDPSAEAVTVSASFDC